MNRSRRRIISITWPITQTSWFCSNILETLDTPEMFSSYKYPLLPRTDLWRWPWQPCPLVFHIPWWSLVLCSGTWLQLWIITHSSSLMDYSDHAVLVHWSCFSSSLIMFSMFMIIPLTLLVVKNITITTLHLLQRLLLYCDGSNWWSEAGLELWDTTAH